MHGNAVRCLVAYMHSNVMYTSGASPPASFPISSPSDSTDESGLANSDIGEANSDSTRILAICLLYITEICGSIMDLH